MDEPTSNVDRWEKKKSSRGSQTESGKAHDGDPGAEHEVEVVAQYADHVIVIDKGKIILDGTPRKSSTRSTF
jgi:energy-coupling factor transport system ATP-binding protein